METTQTTNTTKMSAIERALAAAKARKAAKNATEAPEEAADTTTPAPVGRKPTLEERAAQKAQRDEDRVARKAAAEEKLKALAEEKAKKKADKAARKAEKAAATTGGRPAHMKKVDRARSKLPPLFSIAQTHFETVTTTIDVGQIEALANHLLVQARAMRTMAATRSVAPPLGSTVRITGGDPKFVGLTGEVVHSQKLRLLVKVEGVKKPVYLYTGEAEVFTPVVEESAAE